MCLGWSLEIQNPFLSMNKIFFFSALSFFSQLVYCQSEKELFFKSLDNITKAHYYLYVPEKKRPTKIVVFSKDKKDSCVICPLFTVEDLVTPSTESVSAYTAKSIVKAKFRDGTSAEIHFFGENTGTLPKHQIGLTIKQFNMFQWYIRQFLDAHLDASHAFKEAEEKLIKEYNLKL